MAAESLLNQIELRAQLIRRLISQTSRKFKKISGAGIEWGVLSKQESCGTDARVFSAATKIQIQMIDSQNCARVKLNFLAPLRAARNKEVMLLN